MSNLQERSSRSDTPTIALLGVSVFLIVFGLVWAYVTGESMMGGMGRHHGSTNGTAASPIGTSIFIIGIILLILSIVLMVFRRGREQPVSPPPDIEPHPAIRPEDKPSEMSSDEMQKLAIRLLSGDERKMFRRIVDEGGEVLQKDLVAVGIFSKAKVTRLLDKLERKGLIVRERYGATNRIRISKDLGK